MNLRAIEVTLNIAAIAVYCILLLFVGVCYIYNKQLFPSQQIITVSSITALLLNAAAMVVQYIANADFSSGSFRYTRSDAYIESVVDILFYSAQMCAYFVFLTRIKYSFDTMNVEQYRVSTCVYLGFCAGMIAFVLLYIFVDTMWLLLCFQPQTKSERRCAAVFAEDDQKHALIHYDDAWEIYLVLKTAMDMLLSIGLLYLFVSRLHRFVLSANIQTLSKIRVLRLLSKIVVLSVVDVIVTQVYYMFMVFALDDTLSVIQVITCVVSGLCVFLSFDFAFPLYRTVCYPLDYCCFKWCIFRHKTHLDFESLQLQMDVAMNRRQKGNNSSCEDLQMELLSSATSTETLVFSGA